MKFDVYNIRKQFPILNQKIYNKPLIYFDNAATTQKPQCVIDALSNYYSTQNSNVHRGVHYLSQQSTTAYEDTRKFIASFLNANSDKEIIFTKGTTEAINLVAYSFGKRFIKDGDEIIISGLEHHSNIVPWQIMKEDRNAVLKVIPITSTGEIDIEKLNSLITKKTKIIAVNHVSNSLGTINNIKEIIKQAHNHNIPVLIDGAQAVSHLRIDVKELDCDFYCFSGHKIYASMGTGILYGKEKWLTEMPPYQGGGEMIDRVTLEKSTYNEIPLKFEAGTPNVADIIALKEAIKYLLTLGYENIESYENTLLEYLTKKLNNTEGIKIIGISPKKVPIVSFNINKIHHYDAGVLLDHYGIAVRTGHHCTQPIMDFFKVPGTIRVSLAFYNTIEEIDIFIDSINKIKKLLE